LEEEDDVAEKAHNERIRVFPGKLAYLIYKYLIAGSTDMRDFTSVKSSF
jgi:hypothetical protein